MATLATKLHVRAPQGRCSKDAIRRLAAEFARRRDLCSALDVVPTALLVLNAQRQIVHLNRAAMRFLEVSSPDEVLGKRPGEVLDCEHAREQDGGCGTTEACTTCGAARVATSAEDGTHAVDDCRIVQSRSGRALELRVAGDRLLALGEPLLLMALTDISGEQRRQALERIFFHDLLNAAGGIMGWAQLIPLAAKEELPEISRTIVRLTRGIGEEVRAQRELAAAEAGELTVQWEPLSSVAVLGEVIATYRNHEVAAGRMLWVDQGSVDVRFVSDRGLLARVLGNMAKNALEASSTGQTVSVGCGPNGQGVKFWVHNQAAMPRDVQLQVFQRSFTTKGPGRGLGTYSIRLLTERYLGGKVTFSSSADAGTMFTVQYPREPSQAGASPPVAARATR